MYLTGIRLSELQHLSPDDVDLESNRLWIRCKTGWHPKNRQTRVIPLVEPLRSYLAQHLAVHSHDEWLFTRHDRKQLYFVRCQRYVKHIGRLFKTINRIAQLAGITQHLTYHLFRHQYASHSQDLGIPSHQIRSILGQTSSQVLQIYTHAEFEAMQSQLQKLGQNLFDNFDNCEGNSPYSIHHRETFPHIFPHSSDRSLSTLNVNTRKTSVPR